MGDRRPELRGKVTRVIIGSSLTAFRSGYGHFVTGGNADDTTK